MHDLIEAFLEVPGDMQLVIAGDADHPTEYSNTLKKRARCDKRIVLTGYLTGDPLHQLFSRADLFVLPSYHEGLPMALLEAMSYGLSVVVTDIPANREVGLAANRYFRPGDIESLREKLLEFFGHGITGEEQEHYRHKIAHEYDWSVIASQTLAVYEKALGAAQ